MWYVYGDLTPFFDRWGSRHTRLVWSGRWRWRAWIMAHLWVIGHPHGSAFLSQRELSEEELNG